MDEIRIKRLSEQIQLRRAGKGIREAAKEVGISHATLSRVENGKIPDLDTFGKICVWLGEDPAVYLGIRPVVGAIGATTARVHFKKGVTIRPESAKALSEMILLAQQAFLEEELES
jgi:transcriptional regulator with XRE-family HTH domain